MSCEIFIDIKYMEMKHYVCRFIDIFFFFILRKISMKDILIEHYKIFEINCINIY